MSNLLTTTPHTEVKVAAPYSDEAETATSREDGIIRDHRGRAYSAGVYEIVEHPNE